jgi:excisionase family DNA binding protein
MIQDGDYTDEQLLLTTVQAASVLGMSRTTVYQLIKNGELRPVHVARCCRISWAELERFVMRLDSANAGPSASDNSVPGEGRRWRRVVTPTGQRRLFAGEVASPDGDAAG